MPDSDTTEMTFTSVYHHKVDGKRRVPIPFRWRPKISVEFILMIFPEQDIGDYIRVLPPFQWAKLLQEIKSMPNDNEQKPILQRIVGSDSTEVRLDSAGRITLPEEAAKLADITNLATLLGNLGHFELWSPARYALMKERDRAEKVNVLKKVRAL
jgi:MraZ protein